MIELQLFTDMRPGEAIKIRPVEIDVTGKVWVYRPSYHKLKVGESTSVVNSTLR